VKGLELSRRYFETVVKQAYQEEFPDEYPRLAFGLAGPGSECYGWDDEISRDHDWGPKVYVWTPDELFHQKGRALRELYDSLPGECCGFGPIRREDTGIPRDGVVAVSGFYETLLGMSRVPEGITEWFRVKEEDLSLCTNGAVFFDGPGIFSRVRDAFASYYPRDVWLKKISSRCVMCAQHGQYNLWRSWNRGDLPAVEYDRAMFAREAAALTFLLERQYRPYYKWQFRALREMECFGPRVIEVLEELYRRRDPEDYRQVIEECSSLLAGRIGEVLDLRPVRPAGNFLQDTGFLVQELIEDDFLREKTGFVE